MVWFRALVQLAFTVQLGRIVQIPLRSTFWVDPASRAISARMLLQHKLDAQKDVFEQTLTVPSLRIVVRVPVGTCVSRERQALFRVPLEDTVPPSMDLLLVPTAPIPPCASKRISRLASLVHPSTTVLWRAFLSLHSTRALVDTTASLERSAPSTVLPDASAPPRWVEVHRTVPPALVATLVSPLQ